MSQRRNLYPDVLQQITGNVDSEDLYRLLISGFPLAAISTTEIHGKWHDIFKSLPRLTTLILPHDLAFYLGDLQQLPRNLTYLDLHDNKALVFDDLQYLPPNLTHLDLHSEPLTLYSFTVLP